MWRNWKRIRVASVRIRNEKILLSVREKNLYFACMQGVIQSNLEAIIPTSQKIKLMHCRWLKMQVYGSQLVSKILEELEISFVREVKDRQLMLMRWKKSKNTLDVSVQAKNESCLNGKWENFNGEGMEQEACGSGNSKSMEPASRRDELD